MKSWFPSFLITINTNLHNRDKHKQRILDGESTFLENDDLKTTQHK